MSSNRPIPDLAAYKLDPLMVQRGLELQQRLKEEQAKVCRGETLVDERSSGLRSDCLGFLADLVQKLELDGARAETLRRTVESVELDEARAAQVAQCTQFDVAALARALARIRRFWPKFDGFMQDAWRDFVERWTYSWQNYSPGLTEAQKQQTLIGLTEELTTRANALEQIFDGDQAPSLEVAEPMPELPEFVMEQVRRHEQLDREV